MEINEVKELLNYIEKSEFLKVEININGNYFKLEKGNVHKELSMDKDINNEELNRNEELKINLYKSIEENIKIIKSPMVGSFHIPETENNKPVVDVGDVVVKGDVVAIIEAMKLMNEIESDYEGEIVEICVPNNSAVGYGDELIKIKVK